MSSAKRRCRDCRADSGATTTAAASPLPPPLPPPIPLDPFLEILARSDATTVVRCAATSKPVRRAIAGPDFRHAITARRATDTNGGGGSFDPALLLGFSCVYRGSCADDYHARVAQQALRGNRGLRFDAGLLEDFEPVAARGGLVVLRQWKKLRVCNSLTGDTICLPPAAVRDEYPPALLAVGDAGRSFELLVADRCLRTQTFSSKEGAWRAVVETRLPPHHCYDVPAGNGAHPVVLGAGTTTIHWLCHRCLNPGVKVLDTGTGQATQIALTPDYLTRVMYSQRLDTGLLLAASPDGRLSLLVPEISAIAMWTLAEEGSASAWWTRQMVIRRQAIARAAMEGPSYSVRFMGFGERSGAVVLQMEGVGLVLLNLGSKEAVVISHEFKHLRQTDLFQLCLHETDLCSLLQAMKPF